MGDLRSFVLAVVTGKSFVADLLNVVSIAMGAVGALIVLYGVYLGYLMATASDEGKRRAAKNRIFKVLSIFLIILALIPLMQVIGNAINLDTRDVDDPEIKDPDGNDGDIITVSSTILRPLELRLDQISQLPNYKKTPDFTDSITPNEQHAGAQLMLFKISGSAPISTESFQLPSGYKIKQVKAIEPTVVRGNKFEPQFFYCNIPAVVPCVVTLNYELYVKGKVYGLYPSYSLTADAVSNDGSLGITMLMTVDLEEPDGKINKDYPIAFVLPLQSNTPNHLTFSKN